jgi:hypothetical protein
MVRERQSPGSANAALNVATETFFHELGHVSVDLGEGRGQRVSGGAGRVVSFDFHNALAAHIATNFSMPQVV